MPLYEYRCETCSTRFELRRPMADSQLSPLCPNGHSGARRVLSVFSATGRSAQGEVLGPAAQAGGCGPGCACAS